MGCGLSFIHILNTFCARVRTRGIQVYLQVTDRFQCSPQLQVVAAVDGSRIGHIVIVHQPVVVKGLVQIAVTDSAESEVKTR